MPYFTCHWQLLWNIRESLWSTDLNTKEGTCCYNILLGNIIIVTSTWVSTSRLHLWDLNILERINRRGLTFLRSHNISWWFLNCWGTMRRAMNQPLIITWIVNEGVTVMSWAQVQPLNWGSNKFSMNLIKNPDGWQPTGDSTSILQ